MSLNLVYLYYPGGASQLEVDALHLIMVPQLQPHLGDVYGVKKPMALCLRWVCSLALCGVGLVADLVLAALEYGGADCCWFVMDNGGSGRLIGGVALASDPALKMLGGLFQPMFLSSSLDPVLRSWWLPRLINALRLGVSSVPKCGQNASALILLRRRKRI
jgi:hypothetical protein